MKHEQIDNTAIAKLIADSRNSCQSTEKKFVYDLLVMPDLIQEVDNKTCFILTIDKKKNSSSSPTKENSTFEYIFRSF